MKAIPINEAARQFGVSRRTIYYWIQRGRLTVTRYRGRFLRVLVGEW